MRLRFDKDAEKKLQNSSFMIKEYPFSLKKDDTLELGMGSGEMLTALAYHHPQKRFIGVEKYPTVAYKAALQAKNLELQNFFIIIADIKDLEKYLEGQTNTIWLTFSDPWPKRKHYKRRLTYKSFLSLYKSFLSEEGSVYLKSDNDKFFLWSLQSIIKYGGNVLEISTDLKDEFHGRANYATKYERRFRLLDKNINYLSFNFKSQDKY